jgi:hypothetical protein
MNYLGFALPLALPHGFVSGAALFANRTRLGSHAASQQKFQKQVGKCMLFVHDADHLLPVYRQCSTGGNRSDSRQAQSTNTCQRLQLSHLNDPSRNPAMPGAIQTRMHRLPICKQREFYIL